MQEKFRQVQEVWVSLLGLLGITLNDETVGHNSLAETQRVFPDGLPSSGTSPNNLLTYAEPVKLEHQVEEKPAP